MKTNSILYKGKIRLSDIKIFHIKRKFIVDRKLRIKINQYWQQCVALAKKDGKKLWNSKVYTLESIYIKNKKMIIYFNSLEYKTSFYFTRNQYELKNLSFKVPLIVGVYGLIKTFDQKYIFGKVNTPFPIHQFNLIGGICSELEQKINKGSDFIRTLLRELNEEINLNQKDIKTIYLWKIIQYSYTIKILFKVNLTSNASEVINYFNKKNDNEVKCIYLVNKQDLRLTLKKLFSE